MLWPHCNSILCSVCVSDLAMSEWASGPCCCTVEDVCIHWVGIQWECTGMMSVYTGWTAVGNTYGTCLYILCALPWGVHWEVHVCA